MFLFLLTLRAGNPSRCVLSGPTDTARVFRGLAVNLGCILESRMIEADVQLVADEFDLSLTRFDQSVPLELLTQPQTPSVVVSDLRSDNSVGLLAQESLFAQKRPHCFLFHAVSADPEPIARAFRLGAIDVVVRPNREQLRQAIQFSLDCYQFRARRLREIDTAREILSGFSQRQSEILPKLIEGSTSRQIGEVLSIAENTVARHRKLIHERTRTHGLAQLIRFYTDATTTVESIFAYRPACPTR